MTRLELEHAIRAVCDVARDDAVYVFGSQAILGQYPDAPAPLRQSAEAHVAPVNAIDMVDVIDANLGELSPFHQAFGYYMHGVAIEAAVLPDGWKRRAIAVRNANTGNMTGMCVEAHDLAASKLVAFRAKDRDFVRVQIAEELVTPRRLLLRIRQLPTRRCRAAGLFPSPLRLRLAVLPVKSRLRVPNIPTAAPRNRGGSLAPLVLHDTAVKVLAASAWGVLRPCRYE